MNRRWRAVLAMALLLVASLVACQPLPHPFANDRPPAALLAVPDAFDISVGSIEGEPRATAAKLPKAIASELLKRNIAATNETTNKNSYQLDGRIEQRPDKPGQSLLTVHWRLRDPKGRVVRERTDRLAAPTHDWAGGSDDRITELAAASAAGLAAALTDDVPKAPKEAKAKEPAGSGRTRVAVRKVAGAPGDGNNSLASSLTAVLKHRDIELVDPANGRPDLAIDGEIKVDPAKEGQQHVKIVWHVAPPAGGEIGQVAQENDVPRGRLDGAWGDIAYSVAMAAESGIMQLVDRGVPLHRRDAEPTVASVPGAAMPPLAAAGGASPSPKSPPVAGNLDSPEVNLPPIDVTPSRDAMPKPLETPDVPVLLPYRGVPVPH